MWSCMFPAQIVCKKDFVQTFHPNLILQTLRQARNRKRISQCWPRLSSQLGQQQRDFATLQSTLAGRPGTKGSVCICISNTFRTFAHSFWHLWTSLPVILFFASQYLQNPEPLVPFASLTFNPHLSGSMPWRIPARVHRIREKPRALLVSLDECGVDSASITGFGRRPLFTEDLVKELRSTARTWPRQHTGASTDLSLFVLSELL